MKGIILSSVLYKRPLIPQSDSPPVAPLDYLSTLLQRAKAGEVI